MKVGVAQIDCAPGDIAANCAKVLAYAEQARQAGCDLVLFPEMTDTGYEVTRVGEYARTWDEDDATSPFSICRRTAHDLGIHLICGLSERVGDTVFNASAAFAPDGELIGTYRKSHLAAYPLLKEDHYVGMGDSLETARIGDLTWGLTICYDLRFPEVFRTLIDRGAQVVALSSAWPFPRVSHWRTLIRARAIENQAYVIAANRTGTDGTVTFCGSSCIVDPYGVTVADAAEDREELIVGEVKADLVASVREYMPLLEQRRQELY